MSKLILTSNGLDSQEIYDEFKKIVTQDSKIAMITTANNKKEKTQGNQDSYKKFLKLGAKQVDFVDIEFQNPEALLDYDIVYLGGGFPCRLMYWIRKTNSQPIFQKLYDLNKVLVGVSAGSMILGENFGIAEYLTPQQNTFNMTDISGLGLCDLSFSPHSNEFPRIFEDFDEKFEKCEKDLGIKITKLYDGHAIIFEDGKQREIGGKVVEIENLC